ncbi:MAG: M18 family aminopeptidase [Bacteroidales bacterium]|nr:M18 family aminopeptidase [Bacteroidales bacterium]
MDKNKSKEYADDLIDFIYKSPNNFFAVSTLKERLLKKGFEELKLSDRWTLKPNGKYFVSKNGSSLFSFIIGNSYDASEGFKLICAHCDSPSFKIKPSAEILTEGNVLKLNTEVYGGPILYTWFDRPLSLAGRVIIKSEDPLNPKTMLVNFNRSILTIPHLAIHFNREVNSGVNISKQKDMLPVIAILNNALEKDNFLLNIISSELNIEKENILDFDLTLYEFQKGELVGYNQEFISSGRLDDLAMVHAGLSAFENAEAKEKTSILAIFDNEETGSGTKQGAASPVLRNIMERIVFARKGDSEDFYRSIDKSFMISADMAHAVHPNYPEKHDPTNHPLMGKGPVIKIHANQKYLSDGDSSSVFETICKMADVPCQKFVNHSDMLGGSTLGNILTSQMEMRGVDIGNPMWAMHSVRETACVDDHYYVIKAFKKFLEL